MCGPQVLGLLGLGGGAAAATGATAAAATAGMSGLAGIGTALAVGGSLVQGFMGLQEGRAQSRALAEQAAQERRINATEDMRSRDRMMRAIAQQRAELAARGVQLDSPTALALGQEAAAEMSYESQAIRSGGAARQLELDAAGRAARARGLTSFLRGGFSAAGSLIDRAPDLWPGFSRSARA